MDDDDRYTRITLRLPKDLHTKLAQSADATSKSLNAEIIARTQASFDTSPIDSQRAQYLEQVNRQMTTAIEGMTRHLATLEWAQKVEAKSLAIVRVTLRELRAQSDDLMDELRDDKKVAENYINELSDIILKIESLLELVEARPEPPYDPQERLFL